MKGYTGCCREIYLAAAYQWPLLINCCTFGVLPIVFYMLAFSINIQSFLYYYRAVWISSSAGIIIRFNCGYLWMHSIQRSIIVLTESHAMKRKLCQNRKIVMVMDNNDLPVFRGILTDYYIVPVQLQLIIFSWFLQEYLFTHIFV